MGTTEKFLIHPEIIGEIKAVPQVTIVHEEEVQVNVITRAPLDYGATPKRGSGSDR